MRGRLRTLEARPTWSLKCCLDTAKTKVTRPLTTINKIKVDRPSAVAAGNLFLFFVCFSPLCSFTFCVFTSLSMTGMTIEMVNLRVTRIVYRLRIQRGVRCLVLTSFPEAQENMIDVLPLDTAVVPRHVLPIFWKQFKRESHNYPHRRNQSFSGRGKHGGMAYSGRHSIQSDMLDAGDFVRRQHKLI